MSSAGPRIALPRMLTGLVALGVSACATLSGEPSPREPGPPRALLVAHVRPDLARPALAGKRTGDDEPDFVLYSDGAVLYAQAQGGLFRTVLTDQEMQAMRSVVDQAFDAAVGEEDERRVAFDVGDGPMLRMTSLTKEGCRRVYVHGLPGTTGAALPPPLSRMMALLRRFRDPQATPFTPEQVLVYLDALPGQARVGAGWPRGWAAPQLLVGEGPGTHVVAFAPAAVGGVGRLEQLVRRGVSSPLMKDGRAYKVSAWRAVLPDEGRWRGDRLTGALPGCAG